MTNFWLGLWQDESGATAVEYALMAALIALVIVTAVRALGGTLSDSFEDVELTGALGGGS
jgi:pilus assembly protein Flp/PilA